MRTFLWTIAALVAVVGVVGLIAWLNNGGPLLGQPIRIAPTTVNTIQHTPDASNFAVGERVSHNKFGHGTVIATDGPKLTVEFDDDGMRRVVLESFVNKSGAPRPTK